MMKFKKVTEVEFLRFVEGMNCEVVGMADCTVYFRERSNSGWPVVLAKFTWPMYGETVGTYMVVDK